MENASKALIIAGAILISILVIGLGVFIYNQASSTVSKANLNSQEAQSQNQQFEAYFGTKVQPGEVKQLLSLIRTNNITGKTADETKEIGVIYNGTLTTDMSTVTNTIISGKTYEVNVLDDSADDKVPSGLTSASDSGCTGYYTSGYIKIITIDVND